MLYSITDIHQTHLHHAISARCVMRSMDVCLVYLKQPPQLLVIPCGDREIMQITEADGDLALSHHSES